MLTVYSPPAVRTSPDGRANGPPVGNGLYCLMLCPKREEGWELERLPQECCNERRGRRIARQRRNPPTYLTGTRSPAAKPPWRRDAPTAQYRPIGPAPDRSGQRRLPWYPY